MVDGLAVGQQRPRLLGTAEHLLTELRCGLRWLHFHVVRVLRLSSIEVRQLARRRRFLGILKIQTFTW